jgi:TRAP transporter 4TM/12TM fusion protein
MLPAILYYLGVFMQVDLEAAKKGLKGLPSKMLPSFRKVLFDGWIFIIPVIVLVYTLFILYLEPDKAGLYTIASTFIICIFKKTSRISLKKLLAILESVGEALIEIAVVVSAAGLIIGVMSVSGLGFSFSLALIELAGGNYFLLLLVAALGASILGMGMPVLASYILIVPLVAPALVHLGMPPICAHMFVFYYAVLSFLTPPVCLSVYAACSIANSKLMPTALQALRLGIAAYTVPFVFAFNPALLLIGPPVKVVTIFVFTMLGIMVLSVGLEGYLLRDLKWFERILAIVSAIGLMTSSWLFRGTGAAIILILLFRQWGANRLSRSRTV